MTITTRLLRGWIGLLLSATAVVAQSSVWKVTRGTGTVYLGGTCHILRPSDFPLPQEFDVAFAASAKIYFETEVERLGTSEMREVVASQGIFTDGKTLAKVLTPKAWKAVQAYCAREGVPLAELSELKPWLFTVMLASLELQKLGVSEEGVDMHYFEKASASGKRTGALETFDQHIAFLTGLGAGHESEMIEQTIEDLDEIPAIMNGLLAAWRSGDVAKLDELLLGDMRKKFPSIYRELLVSRNNAWLPQIEAMLKTPEVEFVLVGVGHAAGPEGLIAQLRARGCAVEQLKAAAAAHNQPGR